ncbi:MAG TPA: hypothetical protein VGJ88_10850 [Thermoanaerobaculia bacterium]|jgi:hypothetical protein
MITKSDWEAVLDQLSAEDRQQLGMPPTADELVAFGRGELSHEETERVQRLLIAYPDLARAVAEPFPVGDERLPDGEIDRRWSELRGRLHTSRESGRVLVFWRALAAGLVIAVAGLVWQQQHERNRPFVIGEEQLLEPDGSRGAEGPPVTLSSTSDWALITVPIIGATGYEDYRLDLYAPDSSKPAWRSGVLPRRSNDAFAIVVPKRFLSAAGMYRIILVGVRGASEETLATYSVRVPKR